MCTYSVLVLSFFFFKQKTAYEMRISDWSSDVCSSDLACPARGAVFNHIDQRLADHAGNFGSYDPSSVVRCGLHHGFIRGAFGKAEPLDADCGKPDEIGRASCRERVCQYV